jgi:hypothetical protein
LHGIRQKVLSDVYGSCQKVLSDMACACQKVLSDVTRACQKVPSDMHYTRQEVPSDMRVVCVWFADRERHVHAMHSHIQQSRMVPTDRCRMQCSSLIGSA